MTDGLKDEHRQAIIAEIAANGRVERAVLFGSRATGTNTVTSDVDVALFGEHLTLTDQARLAVALDGIPMAQSVDLVLYDSIRDRELRQHIQSQGVVWFARLAAKGTNRSRSSSVAGDNVAQPPLCLDDVADITMGQSPPGETVSSEAEVPLLNGPTEFGAHHPQPVQFTDDPRRFAERGDLLFCVRGSTTGRMNWADRRYAIGRGVAAIRHREDPNLQPFVRGVIEFELLRLLAHATGSTFPNVSGQQLAQLPCPDFNLDEQRAISQILGTLDDKIVLNRRMSETLEAMAGALFKSWFVDFDPVRAKMEGRDTGLTEDIANLFPDRLIDSEMGEIPERWDVVPLDAVARFQNGLALQKFRPAPNEERLPVVKIAQLRAGEASSNEWASSSIKPGCIIEDGDVLFSWSGSLLVKIWCGGRAALNQHLFKVTSKEYPKWFYLQSLLSHLAKFRRIAQDKATTMGHIKRHHLTEALCAAPPDGVIERLSGTSSSLLEGRVANELSSRTHVALRDALLPKLISGEIRIPDAERALEAPT